jgi:hypothetical protein
MACDDAQLSRVGQRDRHDEAIGDLRDAEDKLVTGDGVPFGRRHER